MAKRTEKKPIARMKMGFGIDISIFRQNFRNGGNKQKTWTAIPLDMLPEHRDCTFTMHHKTSARRSLTFACMARNPVRERNFRRQRQSGADPFLTARQLVFFRTYLMTVRTPHSGSPMSSTW